MRKKQIEHLLNDAIGLLMNIEQKNHPGWKKDYNKLMDEYDKKYLGQETVMVFKTYKKEKPRIWHKPPDCGLR